MPVSLQKYYRHGAVLKLLLLASLGLCSAVTVVAAATPEKPKASVADLRYGVALYHYYQQDYLPALSELMVANARDGIHGHGDNPLLIEGGVSLAFGMPNHAEHIFSGMLQDPQRPQSVRDAAWFYLGKLQYARSDWQAAQQSFNKVSQEFNPGLLAEMHALQINVQIKHQQFLTITPSYVEQQAQGSWTALTLYNVFSAHARAGDIKTAQQFLNDLTKLSPDDKNKAEYIALRDKANTAMGYHFLQEKNYPNAAAAFKKVSLEGIASSQALLGYGWATMAQEQYKDAISAWQVLQTRSLLQTQAQEALVALPFAYEKLNARGDALREYEKAEQLLQQELSLVQTMRTSITNDELLALIASNPTTASAIKNNVDDNQFLSARIIDDGQNWLKINATSILKTRSLYLRELFSSNQFQAQVLDLRDLLKLQALLNSWQPKLVEYTQLLQQKQLLRQHQEQKIAQQSLTKQVAELQQQRDQLSERLTAIKTNHNYLALADDRIKALSKKLDTSNAALQQLKISGKNIDHDQARLHILRGVVLWRAAEQFPAAIAHNEMTMAEIDSNLGTMVNRNNNIQQINTTGLDLQPLLARLQDQQQKLHLQRQLVDAVIATKSAALGQQVDKQLLNHEQRLHRYLAQSHLAVARLYDAELRKQAP